jgi:hypothetical protein
MVCTVCGGRQEQFDTELCIHFSGVENLDRPHVYESPNMLICMDCGDSCFSVSKTTLRQLEAGQRVSRVVSNR